VVRHRLVRIRPPMRLQAVAAVNWLQITIATVLGGVCGLWVGLEAGRLAYNHKMDELRGEIEELQAWLTR
jgi:membrane protein YqaA with SNARE-associated domain